jgi:FtsH-binding integral membrane protein
MELSNLSIIILLALFALVHMIYKNVSSQLTTKSYIATTYMYIFFALLLIVLINDMDFIKIDSGAKFTALAFLTIVLVFVLALLPQENQLMKHLAWIAFVGCLAIMLAPTIDFAKSENILNNVLITISIMFATMTYFAYNKPLGYFDSWYPFLYSSLLGIVVLSLVNIIFSDLNSYGFNSRNFIISCVSILVFNGFLLYDTQKIIKQGKILNFVCAGKNNLECADYPTKSLSVILDVINLFTATTRVYKN